MDETQIKHVIEAALLAAGRPLPLDVLASLFVTRASELDKGTLQRALDSLAADYRERGLELKEVASGYRVQIRSSMTDWLTPLWEERAPRYTRALLETLALVAYRQPITRAEIEEVRGVSVSTNIIRTLMERNWIRVVGHRDVPGKPAMFGTTREFLDYFGLKKLEELPPLADIKDGLPELSPQTDLIDALGGDGEQQGAEGDESEPQQVAVAAIPLEEDSDAAAAAMLSDAAAGEELIEPQGGPAPDEDELEGTVEVADPDDGVALDGLDQASSEHDGHLAARTTGVPFPLPEDDGGEVRAAGEEGDLDEAASQELLGTGAAEELPLDSGAAEELPPDSGAAEENYSDDDEASANEPERRGQVRA